MLRGFVAATIALLVAFGAAINGAQTEAMLAFSGALLTLAQAWSTRQSVTPVDKAVQSEAEADRAIEAAYYAGVSDARSGIAD